MRAFSPALPPAKRPTSAWTPAALATLRQWLGSTYYSSPVGGLQVIESLEPHGTVRAPQPGACALFDGTNDYGTLGGSNRLTSGGQTTFTITATLIPNSITGNLAICSEWDAGAIFALHQSNAKLKLLLYYSESPTLTSASTTDSDVLAVGVPVKIAVTYNAGVVVFYVNGVVVANTQVGGAASALRSAASTFRVGALATGTWCYDGKLADIRVYSVAKTAPEVAAIAACDYTNLDKTGIIAHYYFNDRAGTVARDSSGNGHDLTLSGPITESTFWAEDSSITANHANVLGYTLSGSTIIPRDESDITKDVQGNALGNTGLSPYPVTIDTPCITFNGTSDYAESAGNNWQFAGDFTISLRVKFTAYGTYIYILGSANDGGITTGFWLEFGSDRGFTLYTNSAVLILDDNLVSLTALTTNTWYHILVTRLGSGTNNVKGYIDGVVFGQASSNATIGNTILPLMIGDGKHNHGGFGLNGSLADVKIWTAGADATEVTAIANGASTLGTPLGSWRCQEGPGTANTNVTLYDDSGNGNHLTVVGGTVADQWNNRCPGYVRDHAFEHGGRLDALGAFVPLVPNTLLCADGNAATIAAGNIAGNPYSRVNFDPFDAAELGALAVPGEFDSLPCVTGNGSNNYIDLGSALIPASGDFTFSGYYYHGTNTNPQGILQQTDGASATRWFFAGALDSSGANTAGALGFISGTGPNIQILGCLTVGSWHVITLSRVGTTVTIGCDGVTASATLVFPFLQANTQVARFATLSSSGQYSHLSITANGTTKHFPLTDGSGDDIAMYEDGVATIISNAIQGTLTNVWDNKTEGQVDHEFPEATRAIVPRDTKFTNGSTKTITTSEPATDADLASILEYIG